MTSQNISMQNAMPELANTDSEIEQCFNVMLELRPHLLSDTFIKQVREMEPEGYKLACIREGKNVVCVAGYRISHNLFMGKNLYVDDLITSKSARSKGYGEKMIKYLRDIAVVNQCKVFHLDSGTQRAQAHKFYFKQNLTIASYHFSEKLI